VVTEKGYHSRALVNELTEWACERTARNRIAEGNGGQGKSGNNKQCRNRRRIRGECCLRLLRQRAEKLERWNQHLYDRGGMRRLHCEAGKTGYD
jgi:hypothetical protein